MKTIDLENHFVSDAWMVRPPRQHGLPAAGGGQGDRLPRRHVAACRGHGGAGEAP